MRIILYLLLFAALIAASYTYIQSGSHSVNPSPHPIIGERRSPTDPSTAPKPAMIDDKAAVSPITHSLLEEERISESNTEAQKLIEGSMPRSPNTSVLFEKALEKFDSGDYKTSLSLFMDIMETDTGALTGAGLSYFKLGDFSNAIRYLEKAVANGEDNFIERKFLALAYYKRDDLNRSIQNAESALRKKEDPELSSFLHKLKRERDTQDTFINEETTHFKVIFDGYVHGNISRKILDILEDAYRDIGNQLNHYPSRTITVLLYSEKDFFDLTQLPVWTAGAYDGKIRLPVRGIEAQDEQFLRTVLYHEYVHAAVHSITIRLPLWMNEGLAEHLVNRGYETIGQVIPLRSLERGFPMDDQRFMTAAYMESYSAVTYLVEEHGLYRMMEFLTYLSQGSSLDDAFLSAFYISYDEFVSSWGKS